MLVLLLAACAPEADTALPGSGDDTAPPSCTPVEADPAPTWEGHAADGWGWTKVGPLFADHGAGATDGDLAPGLVHTDQGHLLLFARKQGLEMTLMASTSDDGEAWSEPVAVGGVPTASALYGALAHDGASYRLWAGSGSLDAWSSADGLDWTLERERVLDAGDAGEFDAYGVLYPAVASEGSAWRVRYTGFDGATYAIGEATSTDGLAWDKRGLVLEAEPGGFDDTAVGQPALVEGEHGWWTFYGGYDTSQTNPGPWRVGALLGEDRMGVSLPLGESGQPDAWSTRDPAVVRTGDGWLMIYVGMGQDAVYRLLAARSSSCG